MAKVFILLRLIGNFAPAAHFADPHVDFVDSARKTADRSTSLFERAFNRRSNPHGFRLGSIKNSRLDRLRQWQAPPDFASGGVTPFATGFGSEYWHRLLPSRPAAHSLEETALHFTGLKQVRCFALRFDLAPRQVYPGTMTSTGRPSSSDT